MNLSFSLFYKKRSKMHTDSKIALSIWSSRIAEKKANNWKILERINNLIIFFPREYFAMMFLIININMKNILCVWPCCDIGFFYSKMIIFIFFSCGAHADEEVNRILRILFFLCEQSRKLKNNHSLVTLHEQHRNHINSVYECYKNARHVVCLC